MMTARHALTIREPLDIHENCFTLIARAADDVSRNRAVGRAVACAQERGEKGRLPITLQNPLIVQRLYQPADCHIRFKNISASPIVR